MYVLYGSWWLLVITFLVDDVADVNDDDGRADSAGSSVCSYCSRQAV